MKITRYGWIRDLPDYRDHYYTPPTMADIPTSVDLRPMMPPVFDQGAIGSCTAQALAALLQYDEIKQNKADKSTPSRLFIYYNERVLQNTVNSDSGASMRIGIQCLNQFGFCEEPLWVYDIGKWRNKPNQTAYRKAITERIASYARVNQDILSIKTALAAGTPIAFGFVVYSNFEDPAVAKSGLAPMPGGSMLGGHAVLAVGYDDADQTVWVRNSWGPGWGIGGYFKMPYAYISNPNLAADFWTINCIP